MKLFLLETLINATKNPIIVHIPSSSLTLRDLLKLKKLKFLYMKPCQPSMFYITHEPLRPSPASIHHVHHSSFYHNPHLSQNLFFLASMWKSVTRLERFFECPLKTISFLRLLSHLLVLYHSVGMVLRVVLWEEKIFSTFLNQKIQSKISE